MRSKMKNRIKEYIMLHLCIKHDIKIYEWYDILLLLYKSPIIFESVIKMLNKTKISHQNDTKPLN